MNQKLISFSSIIRGINEAIEMKTWDCTAANDPDWKVNVNRLDFRSGNSENQEPATVRNLSTADGDSLNVFWHTEKSS